jgi:membrane protein required for colicin V production
VRNIQARRHAAAEGGEAKMEALSLNAFDAVALAIILISGIMAFARGLLREVFSIVAFIGAGLAALYLSHMVVPLLAGTFKPPIVAEFAAAILVFLVVFIAVTLVTSMLTKAVHQSPEIGMLDRLTGLAFGVLRGVLILALVVLLMRHITGAPQAPMPTWMTEARLYPILEKAAVTVESVIPKARNFIREKTAPDQAQPAPQPGAQN